MESIKLLVFVVLVTLGRGAFALCSTSFHGLSEEELAVLSVLRANREKAISGRYGGHYPIYYLIKKSVAEYLFDLQPASEDDSEAMVAEATRMDKIGVDYVLDSIPIALRKSCDGIETTRTKLHAYLDDAYPLLLPAIKLARSGNYSDNLATDQVNSVGEAMVAEIYTLIRTCQNVTDADTLAAMEAAQNGSATGLYYVTTALFHVLKIFGVAVASGNKSEALISDTDEALEKTLSGLRGEVYNECSVLEAFYINSLSNRSRIVSDLILNQFTAMTRSYNFKEAVKTMFDEIVNEVNKIILQLLDDGELVFSRTDSAEAKAAAFVANGTDHFLESILVLYPEISSAVEDDRKVLHALTDKIVSNNFLMMKVALDKDNTYSNITAEIETLDNEAVRLFRKVIEILFGLIRNDHIWSDEAETELANIENNVVLEANNYLNGIKDGMTVLAEAAHKNGTASTDYISSIQAIERRSISAVEYYVKYFSEAFLFAFLACN